MDSATETAVREGGTPPLAHASESDASNPRNGKTRKPYTITKVRERWTDEEHTRFLDAIKMHGRSWGKVASHVGTKSTVQIRSHAQKYFNRLKKQLDTASSNPMDSTGYLKPGCDWQQDGAVPGRQDSSAHKLATVDESLQRAAEIVAAAATEAAAAAAAVVVAAAGKQIREQLGLLYANGMLPDVKAHRGQVPRQAVHQGSDGTARSSAAQVPATSGQQPTAGPPQAVPGSTPLPSDASPLRPYLGFASNLDHRSFEASIIQKATQRICSMFNVEAAAGLPGAGAAVVDMVAMGMSAPPSGAARTASWEQPWTGQRAAPPSYGGAAAGGGGGSWKAHGAGNAAGTNQAKRGAEGTFCGDSDVVGDTKDNSGAAGMSQAFSEAGPDAGTEAGEGARPARAGGSDNSDSSHAQGGQALPKKQPRQQNDAAINSGANAWTPADIGRRHAGDGQWQAGEVHGAPAGFKWSEKGERPRQAPFHDAAGLASHAHTGNTTGNTGTNTVECLSGALGSNGHTLGHKSRGLLEFSKAGSNGNGSNGQSNGNGNTTAAGTMAGVQSPREHAGMNGHKARATIARGEHENAYQADPNKSSRAHGHQGPATLGLQACAGSAPPSGPPPPKVARTHPQHSHVHLHPGSAALPTHLDAVARYGWDPAALAQSLQHIMVPMLAQAAAPPAHTAHFIPDRTHLHSGSLLPGMAVPQAAPPPDAPLRGLQSASPCFSQPAVGGGLLGGGVVLGASVGMPALGAMPPAWWGNAAAGLQGLGNFMLDPQIASHLHRLQQDPEYAMRSHSTFNLSHNTGEMTNFALSNVQQT